MTESKRDTFGETIDTNEAPAASPAPSPWNRGEREHLEADIARLTKTCKLQRKALVHAIIMVSSISHSISTQRKIGRNLADILEDFDEKSCEVAADDFKTQINLLAPTYEAVVRAYEAVIRMLSLSDETMEAFMTLHIKSGTLSLDMIEEAQNIDKEIRAQVEEMVEAFKRKHPEPSPSESSPESSDNGVTSDD